MKLLKFGGTSMGSACAIREVADIIVDAWQEKPDSWVVVSALAGTTNQLLRLGSLAMDRDPLWRSELESLRERHLRLLADLCPDGGVQCDQVRLSLETDIDDLADLIHGVSLVRELSARSSDLLLSFGERLSARILACFLRENGLPAIYVDARRLIVSDETHGHASVDYALSGQRVADFAAANSGLPIVCGFIAATADGITTTLGRGGSDYSAAILGAALGAEEVQLWSDVNGVMTADPSMVAEAFSLSRLSFEEAMELSHFGAKVINPHTLIPAMEKGIPIRSLNTFDRSFPGTLISRDAGPHSGQEESLISGISSIQRVALLRLQGGGMMGVRGISSRLFAAIAAGNINIIMITQASSEHSICFAILPESAERARKLIETEFELEMRNHMIDPLVIEQDLSIVAIVGASMIRRRGLAGRLFSILGHNGINVVAIAQGSSELNISVVIAARDEKKALNALHAAFFKPKVRRLNILQIGTGLVGAALMDQLDQHYRQSLERDHIDLRVVAVANSRGMLSAPEGLGLAAWRQELAAAAVPGGALQAARILDFASASGLSDLVLVDCSASTAVVNLYPDFLRRGISIVTPNKLANSGPIENYHQLRRLCERYGSRFFYETNVGAGLPVINTLQELLRCGQKPQRIEGLFSGTLSYIFSTFQESGRFSDIVRQAQALGYTEPDPRQDLGGLDVARKLLILAREAGNSLELDEVDIVPLLPPDCFEAPDVETFYTKLAGYDDHFEELRRAAAAAGRALRFVAAWQDGKAKIGMAEVDSGSPFWQLQGSENIIAFYTEHYDSSPMIIKGPGAGASVTAAGVFSDLVRCANTGPGLCLSN
ncbi:MAG: bifunctional aspartate kinase/homoserine dehydrogenase I [Spirochaetes bacterium]|nr:bifunctional aspartate kinase/homoserine dehydrogenase I [Spirochaetota bacterium]